MTFRLPFQISRVGALCRPVNGDAVVSKLVSPKGNLQKLILYHTIQDPSSNLLQCNNKVSCVPDITKYNSSKLNEHPTKQHSSKSVRRSRSKLVVKEGEASSDHYQQMGEINFGPYFNRRPSHAKSKLKFAKLKSHSTQLHSATSQCGMDTYFHEIQNIDDTMSTAPVKPVISPPEPDINNIMPDSDLKIQNDIWKKSGFEIINNLNSKNSMWRFIYGKRKSIKHGLWKDFSTTKMFTKLIQSQASAKNSAKNCKIHQGTRNYSAIYLSKNKKPKKLNLDKTDDKLLVSSQFQRSMHKSKQCFSPNTIRKQDSKEKSNAEHSEEHPKDTTQSPTCGEPNAISDTLAVGSKELINDCKYKISHLPLKLTASKMFVRHQSKSSKTNLQTSDTYIKVNRKSLSKPNVIMAAVNNRQLNNPSPEFMEQYSYNNSFYHMNAMKHVENYQESEIKYPKVCYNPENDTYWLHHELVAEGVIENETKAAAKPWKTNQNTEKTSPSTITIKKANSNKNLKPINVKKLTSSNKLTSKISPLKTTNEGIIEECSSKILNVRNIQSAKAANLEKLNEAVSETKQKLVKLETPLIKKDEQKVRNKVKSTRLPKTLGQIYGVGKIPFLVEVSKPGQAKHQQYLIVIQLPENNRQETSENNTNSPIPLTLNTDFNDDLLKESLLSETLPTETINPEINATAKKHVPRIGSMIGLVKVKNKILPLLEINDEYKGFEPMLPTKLSQLSQPKLNKKDEKPAEWSQNTTSQHRLVGQEVSKETDEQPRVAAFCSGQKSTTAIADQTDRYEKMHDQLQRVMHMANYIKDQRKATAPVLCKQVRQYSTLTRRNQPPKASTSYKILPKVRHTNRNFDYQQKRNQSCRVCSRCGQYPCTCYDYCCTPCGWCCRPGCCPKFKLDYCCPPNRCDCSIPPTPPSRKIDAPYPSYGECMPVWCKEPTECFDYDQHILQPKNQVSQKIPLMQESIPKVTVVDPALERKCLRDKWCEPFYPEVDQRICFECPFKVPPECCCCPRGRPHCYCWPERPCIKTPPPYRCFSDEDLEFPEVEVTEHDLARKFASDLYRRMGRKCKLPFAPFCSVQCDLRTGEPRPVYKYDPKGHCSTTCLPPGTYRACCTPVRIPPCQIPEYDTCINCCMPMEGIKKTRCSKKCCPTDCCDCCPKDCCNCCPSSPRCCPSNPPCCPINPPCCTTPCCPTNPSCCPISPPCCPKDPPCCSKEPTCCTKEPTCCPKEPPKPCTKDDNDDD